MRIDAGSERGNLLRQCRRRLAHSNVRSAVRLQPVRVLGGGTTTSAPSSTASAPSSTASAPLSTAYSMMIALVILRHTLGVSTSLWREAMQAKNTVLVADSYNSSSLPIVLICMQAGLFFLSIRDDGIINPPGKRHCHG